MATVSIYIQDTTTSEYNRVDLFSDEKISVTSSIQNINDIAKTYTDFSQTFTVPASKQNNKIFKHWYDNSNDFPFSTLVKSNAYIEIDTIPFRKGKIQLESANVVDGQAQDYSITFIGILGNLKDTFAGKFLKDLTSTAYDFNYTAANVAALVLSNPISDNIMFPLISSVRRWIYGSTTGSTDDINNPSYPIRYNELFPAIRLRAVLNMIETQFGINFDGTTEEPSTFLNDARFTNAYLYLKNADSFEYKAEQTQITFQNKTADTIKNVADTTNNSFYFKNTGSMYYYIKSTITITPTTPNITYKIILLKNGIEYFSITTVSIIGAQSFVMLNYNYSNFDNQIFTYYIVPASNITFNTTILNETVSSRSGFPSYSQTLTKISNQTVLIANISIVSYMPEIKIEDFFSGLLKMFNLTCYSNDGINYTVEQLESYYGAGSDIDITKYVLQDKKALNRVKTYKKINFEYEKSESFVNVAFNSANNIEYGTLRYVNNPPTEGEEYSVKLPFEDLNFSNLSGLLQVGYCLKTDNQSYIPKPIILYDYNPNGLTTVPTFQWSNNLTGPGTGYTTYKAFGQETLISAETYGLNFPPQQSTLTNEIVTNGLYQNYYSDYFANIYNYKARLVKLSAILPTSILTTLKLNDSIIIRDAKYLINTYTTDLTTGLVQFELLTDERVRELPDTVVIGTQTWTNTNLDVENYRNGDVIPQVTDTTAWANLTTGAWCYYNNDTVNGAIYGKTYNWFAVNDSRGLAPTGYHIPSDTEWTTLTTYLGGEAVAGGKMKEEGTTHWNSPNTDATNSSKFTGLPGGFRNTDGTFYGIGSSGYWWSSSEYDTTHALGLILDYDGGIADRLNGTKTVGSSIRLIKD